MTANVSNVYFALIHTLGVLAIVVIIVIFIMVCNDDFGCDVCLLSGLLFLSFFPARQNGDFGQNFAYFPLIFCLFSAYGTPSAVFKPTCLRNLPIFVYFRLFSAYFPPKMVPHPTHLLFFRSHVYGFRLFSA